MVVKAVVRAVAPTLPMLLLLRFSIVRAVLVVNAVARAVTPRSSYPDVTDVVFTSKI